MDYRIYHALNQFVFHHAWLGRALAVAETWAVPLIAIASLGGADRQAFTWIVHHRLPLLDPIFVGLTYLGTGGVIWGLIALVIAWRMGQRLLPVVLISAFVIGIADGTANLLKLLVNRPRPFVSVAHVSLLITRPASASFPSSHATTALAGAVLLSWFWPRSRRGFLLLAIAIAFSRVYVGVHYPADVLAGAAIGTAIALAAIRVIRTTRLARFAPGSASELA